MILRRIFTNQYVQIWLFGLAALFFILAGIDREIRIIAILPFLALIGVLLIAKPSLVLLLFICSFYVGDPLFYRYMLLLDSADFSLLLLAAAILSVVFGSIRPSLSLSRTDSRLMSLLTMMIIVSIFSVIMNLQTKKSSDIATSIWYVFNFIQLIAVYLIFSRSFIRERKESFINTVLVLSFIELVIASGQFLHSGPGDVDVLRDVRGTFVLHHAMLGNMMVLPMALCIYRFMTATTPVYRAGYLAGIVASLYTIVISGSRSMLLGLFAAGFIWLVTTFRISRKYFISLLIVGMVVVGIGVFTPLRPLILNTFKNKATMTLDISSYGRLLIWKGAVTTFVQAPLPQKLLGVGIGNYYTIKYPIRLIEGNTTALGAHNNFLHVLMETGIVGFIVFVALFTFLLVNLRRRSKTDRLSFVYFYATIALLFSGITQETFWFQPAFSRFWLLHMLFIGICLGNGEEVDVTTLAATTVPEAPHGSP